MDNGIIVDRLGKSASESFQTGLDRRESGAIPRVSSSPLCQYIILHGEQVNTVIAYWCPTQASRNGGAHLSGRVNSRDASDKCIPGSCHAGCGLHTAQVCRSLNRRSCSIDDQAMVRCLRSPLPPRTMPPSQTVIGSNDCRRPAGTASLGHFADWAERLQRSAIVNFSPEGDALHAWQCSQFRSVHVTPS